MVTLIQIDTALQTVLLAFSAVLLLGTIFHGHLQSKILPDIPAVPHNPEIQSIAKRIVLIVGKTLMFEKP